MKIVVLDGHTLNPGDLNWDVIAQFGELSIYPKTEIHEVIARSKDAQIIISNKAILNKEIIEQLPNLKYIGISATGYNTVDIAAAKARNIPVTNVPNYGTDAVAQHTFALLLALTNQVERHSQSVHQGDWAQSEYWCYWHQPIIELTGKTMGIVGLGSIGKRVADIALAFGMKVLAHTRTFKEGLIDIEQSSLENVFMNSDVVSLHLPQTNDNKGFVNQHLLGKMKKSAYLINTARGTLIDEQALANALNSDKLAGAALDVLAIEPPASDNPLLGAKNCIITPHNAWGSLAARQRLMSILADNIAGFLVGELRNVVNR